MKKFYVLVASVFFTSLFILSQTLVIDGSNYTVDTLAHFPVGPGVAYTSLRLEANKALNVFFLKVATANPHISFKTVLGCDSVYTGETPSKMAKRKSKEGEIYIAGTNGDFYGTNAYPISGCMVESEIAKTPAGYGNLITFTKDNFPKITKLNYKGVVKFSSESWEINSVNSSRETDFLVLYNPHYGKTSRTNAYGTEIQIELLVGHSWGTNKTIKAKVLKVEKNGGNMFIPKGCAVLSGNGLAAQRLNALSKNDEIEIILELKENDADTTDYAQFLGGEPRPLMLKDGIVETNNIWGDRHPRTGVGFSVNKDTIIFCVVDGRSAVSAGVSTKQLAELMKSAGAYTALNLDGGGSSCMYIKEFDQVNKPSDGKERAVSNAIFAVSSAPTDNTISKIIPYSKTIRLPRYGSYLPEFLAYNQYGTLLNKKLDGVSLSCNANVGEVMENGHFIASGTDGGVLNATYNNVHTQIKVELIESSEIKFALDSVLIDNISEIPIEIQVLAEGKKINVSPIAFSWEVKDESICTLNNGMLKGLKNGRTQVIGTLNDFKDTLIVRVETVNFPQLIADNFTPSSWELKATKNLNAVFNTNNRPSAWNHGGVVNYVYKKGRTPEIKLSKKIQFYGRPDTIKIILNVGDIEFNKITLSLQANNDSKHFTKQFDVVNKNKDTELVLPVSELFDVSDQGIYPLGFNFVQFYLNPQIPDRAYALALKEIVLCYKGVSVGIDNPTQLSSVSIYPNPVRDGELYIRCDTNSKAIDVKIYDLQGNLLCSKSLSLSGGEAKLSIGEMAKGAYLLNIALDSKEECFKVIKY